MKKFRDVYLAMVLSALFLAAQIQVQSKAQDKPAIPGQLSAPQGQDVAHDEATAEKPDDSLGRSTPHGTVIGFLQTAQNGKYKEATQYLQLSNNERRATGEELARQLHAVMDNTFLGRVGAITSHREGSIQPGVSQDHEQIGVFRINGVETPVDLVRVSDPRAGDIWLFSSQTLAQVPDLFEQIESDRLESHLPAFLSTTRILRMPLWRWLAFLLLIPVAFGVAWVIVKVAGKLRRLWLHSRQYPVIEHIQDSLTRPLVLILTVLFHRIAIRFFGVPLLFRLYYQRTTNILLVAGIAWLAFRIVNRWGERARTRALSTSKDQSGSIVLLGQRILKVLIGIIAGLSMLSILGFDLTTAIAGLGIGSIALAFAAQKTLENLLGGVSIIGDQVVRVGEFCRVADREGIVEGISLRSTRIRTLQSTELSVPNGQLANMNLENLSRRDKFLFEIRIGLRQETSPAQLRSFLTDVRLLLLSDARVGRDNFRVRFVGIGESSFDLEIFCYLLTSDFDEFFAIREDLLLHLLDLMAAKGIGLAVPVRTLHLMRDQNLHDEDVDQQHLQQRRRVA
jgi:MscS family membrane protein